MGFGAVARAQRSGGAGRLQLLMQIRSGDSGNGATQSHVVQKLQSICVHESTVPSWARQSATQVGFDAHSPPIMETNACPAHSVCTRASSVSHGFAAALS
jgi:hypothetical protein